MSLRHRAVGKLRAVRIGSAICIMIDGGGEYLSATEARGFAEDVIRMADEIAPPPPAALPVEQSRLKELNAKRAASLEACRELTRRMSAERVAQVAAHFTAAPATLREQVVGEHQRREQEYLRLWGAQASMENQCWDELVRLLCADRAGGAA